MEKYSPLIKMSTSVMTLTHESIFVDTSEYQKKYFVSDEKI